MFCENCGKKIEEDSAYCRFCGQKIGEASDPSKPPTGLYFSDDKSSPGFCALSFFFPIAGFILWLVWQDKYKKRAASCGKGALAGVIVSAVLVLILGIRMLALF